MRDLAFFFRSDIRDLSLEKGVGSGNSVQLLVGAGFWDFVFTYIGLGNEIGKGNRVGYGISIPV